MHVQWAFSGRSNSRKEISIIKQFFAWLVLNKDLLTVFGSVATIMLAIYGLNTWRRQIKGNTIFSVARDIIEQALRVKAAFSNVRNIYMSGAEFPEEYRESAGLSAEEKANAIAYAYNTRFQKLDIEFVKLEDLKLKMLAMRGERYDAIFAPLRRCRAELIVALEDYIEILGKKRPTDDDSKRMTEVRRLIREVEGNSELDPVTPRIEAAVGLVVTWIKPDFSGRLFHRLRAVSVLRNAKNFTVFLETKKKNKKRG